MEMIRSVNAKGAFTIGIFGTWGQGKTSMLRQIECGLKNTKNEDETEILSVWFNPWQFTGEEHVIIPFFHTLVSYLKEFKTRKDAIAFCNRLSDLTGLQRLYTRESDGVIPNWGANGYRLPFEAEWEYACCAGISGELYGNLDEIAWYTDNSNEGTHGVGGKKENSLGLYDMLGNVWEWCWDWYGLYPAEGQTRVIRGGGLSKKVLSHWAAGRYFARQFHRGNDVGFRLARSF